MGAKIIAKDGELIVAEVYRYPPDRTADRWSRWASNTRKSRLPPIALRSLWPWRSFGTPSGTCSGWTIQARPEPSRNRICFAVTLMVGPTLFLASDSMSGYVTGHILEVNGGMYSP